MFTHEVRTYNDHQCHINTALFFQTQCRRFFSWTREGKKNFMFFYTGKYLHSNNTPSPFQSRSKAVVKPFQLQSRERTHSEGEVNEKWKVKNGKSKFRKNFFVLILHTYIGTSYNTHSLSALHGFQIPHTPTLILH